MENQKLMLLSSVRLMAVYRLILNNQHIKDFFGEDKRELKFIKEQYPDSRLVFLGDPNLMYRFTSNMVQGQVKVSEGVYRRTAIASSIGMMIIEPVGLDVPEWEKTVGAEFYVRGMRQKTEVIIPDPDYLFENAENHNPLRIAYCPYGLKYHTKAAVQEQRVAEEKRKAVVATKLKEMGVEVTEETIKLAEEIAHFDCSYDYSDDHKYCIRYREYERQLDARLAKYPELVAYKAKRIKESFGG